MQKINKMALLAGVLALIAGGAAAAELAPKPALADVIKASRPSDWRALDPQNTMYMELPGGRVVIEMAPVFAPNHVDNIRTGVGRVWGLTPRVRPRFLPKDRGFAQGPRRI